KPAEKEGHPRENQIPDSGGNGRHPTFSPVLLPKIRGSPDHPPRSPLVPPTSPHPVETGNAGGHRHGRKTARRSDRLRLLRTGRILHRRPPGSPQPPDRGAIARLLAAIAEKGVHPGGLRQPSQSEALFFLRAGGLPADPRPHRQADPLPGRRELESGGSPLGNLRRRLKAPRPLPAEKHQALLPFRERGLASFGGFFT